MSAYLMNDLISEHTGLSLGQLEAARNDPSKCRGCYNRLVSLLNAKDFAKLKISRAIEIINQAHPLISGSSLTEWNILPIKNCPNLECKCQKTWAELRSALAKRSENRRENSVDVNSLSKSESYYASSNRNNKEIEHLIYILENTILDNEDLHGIDLYG